MIGIDELLGRVEGLQRAELVSWIEHRWVKPRAESGGVWQFAEIDVARVELLCDMRDALEVNESALPVVLSLLDQVYALRRRLRSLAVALAAQPEDVQAAIWAGVKGAQGPPAETEGDRDGPQDPH